MSTYTVAIQELFTFAECQALLSGLGWLTQSATGYDPAADNLREIFEEVVNTYPEVNKKCSP